MEIIYAIIIALTSMFGGKMSDQQIRDNAERIYQSGDYKSTTDGIIVIDVNDLS